MTHPESWSPTTRAVRAGIAADREHGAVVPPIHLSSTFAFERLGRPRTYDYTRSGNPTRGHLAAALADLEGGAGAVVTSTGMSGVALVLQLLQPGHAIVAAHDCYGGTQRLLRALAARGHFSLTFADLAGADAERAIVAASPKLVWVETPSNPLLRITDVARIAEVARRTGALLAVDNTFLSPALQRPLALGADVVVHSTTKYLNGHSDVVGGAVIAREPALAGELAWWANCLGVTGAPFDSFLTLRGLRTLHARMRDHLAATDAVVGALTQHAAVRRVHYPGLPDHPGHDIARRQQSGFGAMVSFELAGGADMVERFVERLSCFTLAESLGGVESLVAHPATMTHASMTPEARAAAGIGDDLVRLSVGIEAPEDLANDLRGALDACVAARATRVAVSAAAPSGADIVLLGAGAIGRELLDQVARRGVGGVPIRICGVVDSTGFVVDRQGLTAEQLAGLSATKRAGGGVANAGGHEASPADAVAHLTGLGLTAPVLVDATPADTGALLAVSLERGFDVVLANKVPLVDEQARVDRLHQAAARRGRTILHEATVGAGLPVLDTLRKLVDAGDQIISIEGCPSGTLGYLFGELGRGERFSDALRRAAALGYAEPDPRVDLSGLDVARKALILARAIGFRGELRDIQVESLVPASLTALSPDNFLDRVAEVDGEWATRVNDARRKGRLLRYRANVTAASIVVGLVSVRLTDSLAALDGTDNQFTFRTARYDERPLVIRGPGAGPAVTAAGMVNDIMHLARGARPRSMPPLGLDRDGRPGAVHRPIPQPRLGW